MGCLEKSMILGCFLLGHAFVFADDALDDVKAKGILKIATDPTGIPFNNKNRGGKYEGFEVDLAEVIAKEIGNNIKIQWVDVKWENILNTVKEGKSHLGMNGLFSPESKIEQDWGVYSDAYLNAGIAVAYDAKKGDLTFKDLQNQKAKIAVFNDPQSVDILKKHGLETQLFDQSPLLLRSLKEGKVEFVGFDLCAMQNFVKVNAPKFKLVPGVIPNTEGKYAIIMKKENKDLQQIVNQAIKKWNSDKAIKEKLKSKYGIEN